MNNKQYILKFSRINVHSLHIFPIYVTHHYWQEPSVHQECDCGGGSEGLVSGKDHLHQTSCAEGLPCVSSSLSQGHFPPYSPCTLGYLVIHHSTPQRCQMEGRKLVFLRLSFKEVISKSIKTFKKIKFFTWCLILYSMSYTIKSETTLIRNLKYLTS